MPRYSYKCNECEAIINLVHSITEDKTDCNLCEKQDCLTKIPSSFITLSSKKKDKGKPGSLVKNSIEDFKQDLKEQKKKAAKEYEPS
jgi:putative FmdB family regulatory protein